MNISEKYALKILDEVSDGVLVLDKSFRIQHLNRAAQKITGYGYDELYGRFCKYVCRYPDCKNGCPVTVALETDQSVEKIPGHLLHKNGKIIDVFLSSSILKDLNGQPVGGVLTFQDNNCFQLAQGEPSGPTIFHGMVGVSSSMRGIFQLIQEISESDASVLIQGESGTGKEMIADAIQKTSLRKDKPYVKVNCSVFPSNLLASELFGHVKGAFTGAMKDRAGRFELANSGTIFLDEIGELASEMQVQLLRVLQQGTFERLGESITRQVDVRIIAATNRFLEQLLKEGKFRQDLYYRLNVVPIFVPALRERKEDIPFLIDYFTKKISLKYKSENPEISSEVMEVFLNYSWPGNVRELENALEYAFARNPGKERIELKHVPPQILSGTKPKSSQSPYEIWYDEARYIRELLEQHHWSRSIVAQKLGMGRTTLWRKMKKYGLLEK
ncbi:MAG: sigma-54 dependent transcriptional regulator [Calditrichia bacterium]